MKVMSFLFMETYITLHYITLHHITNSLCKSVPKIKAT